MTNKDVEMGRQAIPYMVLVHWPSASDVVDGIKSWLSVLEGNEPLLSRPGIWEIGFLDWEALEAFEDPSQDALHIVERFSRGSIVYRE
jgi:hypothetical protein